MNKAYIISILSLLIFSCNQNNQSHGIHPNAENLPDPEQNNEHIISKEINTPLNLKFLEDQYGLTKLFDTEENLGFIKDIEVDRRDRIYVLDDRQQKVFIYSPTGNLIQTVGRRGQGPGELSYAKAIAIYQDSLLLISNQYRIEEYDISNDSISFNRTINFEMNIKSICTTSRNLYIHNFGVLDSGFMDSESRKTKMLHKFTIPDYSNQLTFGESYIADSPVVVDKLTQGEIICDSHNNMLVYVPDKVNFIEGYSLTDGKQIWKSSISNLNYPKIEEITVNGNSGVKYIPSENDIFDKLLTPILIQNGKILVQVDRREIVNKESFDSNNSVLSYLIDTRTGEGQYYSDKLKRILHLSTERLIEVNDSFTELKVKSKINQ